MTILLAFLLQTSWTGWPEDLRDTYRKILSAAKETKWFPAKRYDDLLARFDRAKSADEGRAVLRDCTQLVFDHTGGTHWIARLVQDLRRDDMAALGAEAVPAEIEIDRIALKDGRTLLGFGGLLARRFPEIRPEAFQSQRELDPNLGVPGIGNFHLSATAILKADRIRVPLPKAFLLRVGSERIDDDGTLLLEGEWARPRELVSRRESIALTPLDIGNGGTLFVHQELGLRCVRRTADFPAMKKLPDSLREELGWTPVAEPDPPKLENLRKVVADLRKKAPGVEWPEPFNPERDPNIDGLVDDDPKKSLWRIRHAIVYGKDLPDLARKDPEALLRLEEQVLAALESGRVDDLAKENWRTIAAVLEHAPRRKAPESIPHVRFPREYSPWRKWPLLVALHGQYSDPTYDFRLWGDLADRAGMILACPSFGSTAGFRAGKEEDEKILGLVRKLCLEYDVDPDRIYVTGISMGGAATWRMASVYGDRWAAVAPEIHCPLSVGQGKSRFPLLANVRRTPLVLLEGEFDGDNVMLAREAVARLREWKAPVEYLEARWFGHDRLQWRYPALLRWFSSHRREAHPDVVEHRAFHRFEAARAWIEIRSISRASVWSKTDGSVVSFTDLTGIRATLKGGTLRIEAIEGKPVEVEVHYDSRIMPDRLEIRAGDKTTSWSPKPSIKRMIERVRATGDRARPYSDSIVIRF